MSFIAELRRRNVIRMAGLYLVGAWLVTQVAGTILPMFGAPDWAARYVVILLAIGFVPALVFSWIFELTPEGRALIAEVFPVHAREIGAAFAGLEPGEQEALAALCRKLGLAQEG